MATAYVLIRSGLFQGSKYPVPTLFRIGRHPENHLHLTDKKVSRFHAIIDLTERGFRIRDLGSRNGTSVNGEKVREAILKHGDEIQVGPIQMAFLLEPTVQDGALRDSISLPPEMTARVRYQSPVESAMEWALPSEASEATPSLVRAQMSRLKALYQANVLLSTETELEGVFPRILNQILALLPADRGVILLLDPRTNELKVKYTVTRSGKGVPWDVELSRTIVLEALKEGSGLLIEDARRDQRFSLRESIIEQDIRSAICVPLVHGRQTLGVIYLDTLGMPSAFTLDDLRMVTAMAAPAAVQIRNLHFMDQLSRAYLDTMEVLANAIEARDHYTVGHTWRVTRLAVAMVDRLGWSAQQRRYTEMGGILHDIGKIAVEDAILRKRGPLTPEEFQKMQLHPEHGARILKDVEFLKPVIPYVLFHQERWDGRGYPFQLKGEDVPVEGRLLAVCDAFDAMTSHRPYRETREPDDAIRELKLNQGHQFDPEMVEAFLDVWNRGEVASILQDYARGGKSVPCPFCSTHIPLGEDPREGVILECPVCAKACVITRDETGWKGELV